jgi:YggT family protein
MQFVKMTLNLMAGAIELILGVRILLKLFAANPNAAFTGWMYSLSEPLIKPFINIFPSPVFGGKFVLDLPALFALFIYVAVIYLILSIGIEKKYRR